MRHQFVFDLRDSASYQLASALPAVSEAVHEVSLVLIDEHGIEFECDTQAEAAQLITALIKQRTEKQPEADPIRSAVNDVLDPVREQVVEFGHVLATGYLVIVVAHPCCKRLSSW